MKVSKRAEFVVLVIFFATFVINCFYDWNDPWFLEEWISQTFLFLKDLSFWAIACLAFLIVLHELVYWFNKKKSVHNTNNP